MYHIFVICSTVIGHLGCEFTTANLYPIKNVHEMALYLFLVYILEAFILSLSLSLSVSLDFMLDD